uniref:Uncharacterized protein n=1 Tax=Anopheles atroparvus TaxID=41427 RepID=A0A182IU64_ANOAO
MKLPYQGRDLEALCQDVQCPVDCPSDSVLQSTAGDADDVPPELDAGRARRSIAMNPRESIKITPNGDGFVHQNQLQPRSPYRLFKRDLAEADHHSLQDVCCPQTCTCRPCPTQTCPRHYVPIVDARGTLPTGQPGSCCPQVYCQQERRCSSTNRPYETFGEGERWNEDPCTECRCEAGESRCLASFCKPLGCKNPITPPGQCCAVCDEKDSIFCPGHANCGLSCRHGFLREPSGCALCACSRKPTPNTTLFPTTAKHSTTTEPVSTTTLEVSTTTTAGSTTSIARNFTQDSGTTLDTTLNATFFAEQHWGPGLAGTGQAESSQDTPQQGNSSTHGPPSEIADSSNPQTAVWIVFIFSAIGVGIALSFVTRCMWSHVKKRHHGKYSTVPVSSTSATPTTTTPNGTITVSNTKAASCTISIV